MIGQVVAHYRIVRKLGEGGMGVVYQAHDQRLDRMVALKFLPHDLPADANERGRFLQEARAASALTHAHACVVHDIQEHDGRPFIVMEFVEGETLRAKIDAGPIPTAAVVEYAIQIGEALQEAHTRGIVHRDVKSENVMITPKHQVKVMDFGLAKLRGAVHRTKTTTTTGTLAYMAPEQIREGIADARSDVFSFGVVLYEMLAGELPFQGEREATLMYAVLNADPEPIQNRRAGLSSEYFHVLDRALEKDPEDRYQSMADMLIDLRRLKRASDRVSRRALSEADAMLPAGERPSPATAPLERPATATGPLASDPAALPPRRKRAGLGLQVAAAAIAAIVGVLVSRALPKGAPRLNPNMTFRTLQVPFTDIAYPGMSQDGKWVAFPAADAAGTWDLYFMNVNGGDVRRITNDSSRAVPYLDISPDGSQIAYAVAFGDGRNEMRIVPTLGGASRFLVDRGSGMHWTPDGARIGYVVPGAGSTSGRFELWSIRPDGSDTRREFIDTTGTPTGRYGFSWSPSGKAVAWIRNVPGRDTQELIVRALASGRERALTHDGRNIDEVCWTPQNDIVFSSNRTGNSNLWMMRASGGAPVQITRGTAADIGMRVSADGRTLLYLQQQPVGHLWRSPIDRADPQQLTNDDLRLSQPSISPDGRTIAIGMGDPDPLQHTVHLFLMDRDGSNRRQVTSGDEAVIGTSWSPGGQLAVVRARAGLPGDSAETFVLDAAHPGALRRVGFGRGWAWVDEHTLYLDVPVHTDRVALDGGARVRVSADSSFAVPSPSPAYAIYFDVHRANAGVWMRTPAGGPDSTARFRKLIGADRPVFGARVAGFAVRYDAPGQLSRMRGPEFQPAPIPGRFTGFGPNSSGYLRADGSEIVYTEQRLGSRLILIEHLR